MLLVEILKGRNKPVVTEQKVFEYQDESLEKVFVEVFGSTKILMQGKKINEILNESSSTCLKLPIQTLIEEKKTVVRKKEEFQHWEKNHWQRQFSDFSDWGIFKPVVTGNYEVQLGHKAIWYHSLLLSDYENSDTRNIIDDFLHQSSLYCLRFQIRSLMAEVKPVAMDKKSLTIELIHLSHKILKIRTKNILMEGNKTNIFFLKISPSVYELSFQTLVVDIKPAVTEK